jgi:ABC-type transporter Mla subunit MlaD
MSEFVFDTEVAEETVPEPKTAAEPATLAVSADEFAALEERILRAVNLVKRERAARAAAEEHAAELGARAHAHAETVENLQKEVGALRAEREAVRQRVERLLSQLDALEA